MSVIINTIDLPNTCHECTLRNKSMCEVTGLYLPTLDERNGCCPLKSIEGLIEKIEQLPIIEDSEGQDRYMAYDVLRTIKEYCDVLK